MSAPGSSEESMMEYATQMSHLISGVWLNGKSQCRKCGTINKCGTMSKMSHALVDTWCEKCKCNQQQYIVDLETAPEEAVVNVPPAPPVVPREIPHLTPPAPTVKAAGVAPTPPLQVEATVVARTPTVQVEDEAAVPVDEPPSPSETKEQTLEGQLEGPLGCLYCQHFLQGAEGVPSYCPEREMDVDEHSPRCTRFRPIAT